VEARSPQRGGEGRAFGAGHPFGRPGPERAEDARRADLELVPRDEHARSTPPAAAARTRRCAAAATAARGADHRRRRRDDGGRRRDGRSGGFAECAEDTRGDAVRDGGAQSSAPRAGGRQAATGHAAGGQRRRQQSDEPGSLEPVRSRAATAAADQLRNANEHRAALLERGRHARPGPRARAASGRARAAPA
jgi:hypothetical protein